MRSLTLVLAIGLIAACGDLSEYETPAPDCAVKGEEGCPCAPKNTCRQKEGGPRLACVEGVCEAVLCNEDNPGEVGCLCADGKPCAEGRVCVRGVCEVDTGQTLRPPADPKCYTPCSGDYVAPDGTVIRCDRDGLMPGCFDGKICRNGSCILPQGKVPTGASSLEQSVTEGCSFDHECPDFQSCIDGACYSDCESDADCNGSRVCHRKACRNPCSPSDTDTCEAGTACVTVDGSQGFCMPVAPSDGSTPPPADGEFQLDRTVVEFDARTTTGSFSITHTSAQVQRFVVRKLVHREYGSKGPVRIEENPLHWLTMQAGEGEAVTGPELVVDVEPEGQVEIHLSDADNSALDRWSGELEVWNEEMGSRVLDLSFARSPEGRWIGSMYYFGNFPDAGLEDWIANKDSDALLRAVGNAFIRRWGALRNRRISLDEFEAAVTAMKTESWKWESVRERCPRLGAPDPNVGCYLYDNGDGIAIFSDFLQDNPIPTGVVELPMALNMRSTGEAHEWGGRIITSETLHYAGDPKVEIRFADDPASCATSIGTSCITPLQSLNAEILVGGRYVVDASSSQCAPDFEAVRIPWLLPGFDRGTRFDSKLNRNVRVECRDTLLPYGKEEKALNLSMASSNPIPDGATRRRRLELVDGAMIDQRTLFIIFREVVPSFLSPNDPEEFSSYGYMVLERDRGAVLTPDEYEANHVRDNRPPPELPAPGCSEDLLLDVLTRLGIPPKASDPVEEWLNGGNVSAVATAVVWGITQDANGTLPILDDSSPERVHYLCVDTGYFNDGPDGSAPCPPGSRVEYFASTLSDSEIRGQACQTQSGICNAGEPCEFDIAKFDGCWSTGTCSPNEVALFDLKIASGCKVGEPCPKKGTCGATLETWKAQRKVNTDLVWHCEDPDRQSCDDNRYDLREGKIFYSADSTSSGSRTILRSLDSEIMDAFRYKTRFRTRAGRSIGFAPEVCIGDAVPYCYDPEAIEAIAERIDCAVHIYTNHWNDLGSSLRGRLKKFLSWTFAYEEELVPGLAAPVVHDGFERLNSELLIMLGDESFTAAFSSRFDLAGQKLADFQGSLFEPNGIDLSGGAGFEMYSLYQAVQYYQYALDRFYRQAEAIWASLSVFSAGEGFITQATATSYFDRLIRASAQKTRAWSEIAKKYQSFNRPDLARLVIERAYAQAYMESFVLAQMMRRVSAFAVVSAAEAAQITKAIELGQTTYRMALLDMRNVYKDISDAQSFYGIPPDYIPFPALDPSDTNAFEKVMARARELARVAAEKEERALEESRSFDTDSALFQAELGRIRGESEGRLAEICGTFPAKVDGAETLVPAIPKYAHLAPETRVLGDPCGMVGNGELHDAMVEIDKIRLDFEAIRQSHRNLMAAAADAEARARQQCARIRSFADFIFEADTQIMRWNDGIRSLNLIIDTTADLLDGFATIMQVSNCEMFGCAKSATSATIFGVLWGINSGLTLANRGIIVGLEHHIEALERAKVKAEILQECTSLQIDTAYEVRALMREAKVLELEVAKVQLDLKLAVSQVQRLRNEALSTMAGQAENEEMAINIEAARNDPNVRIYRNDTIAAADRTFHETLKEAYRATKVYEYYTSQSYAALEKLFLTRMVSYGDFTLESYLDELERSFWEFQEQYGNPDMRVAILSLRDDIFRIPRLDGDGLAISEQDRSRMFRERLQDDQLLDGRGYIVIPFRTYVEDLSPLTRNHKVRYVEAEIIGDRTGDSLGRVYLTQKGTGVVRTVSGSTNYYAFPVRTAVINPFFNGVRPLDLEVYRNERLRDRPYVNTAWELVFNRKDERVNQDIDLASLTDVRLYVYYTDFTEL